MQILQTVASIANAVAIIALIAVAIYMRRKVHAIRDHMATSATEGLATVGMIIALTCQRPDVAIKVYERFIENTEDE